MTNNIQTLSHLSKDEVIQKFGGEKIAIYDDGDNYRCKGTIILDLFNYMREKYQGHSDGIIKITLKDLDADISEGSYTLKSIMKIQDNYIEKVIDICSLELLDDYLVGEIKLSNISIDVVTELEYEEFLKKKNEIDWKRIKIPANLSGKDNFTEADAFEAMCQEIVEKWGAKDFERIGKGADRGRDGTFKISADSWIPIITGYSNNWILQCKYSKDYSNLQIDEIYKEVVKVIMHKPDYYLLMTNRKVTSDLIDWFKETLQNNKYYIPFKCILIDRQQIESVLENPEMSRIKKKYFG